MLVAEKRIIIVYELTADIHNLLYIMYGLETLAIDIILCNYIPGLLCPQIHHQTCHIHPHCVVITALKFS